MGGLSMWHWLIAIAVIAVLFGGKGKISGVMGDFAKGIKAFKSGMKDEETVVTQEPPPRVGPPPVAPQRTVEHSAAEHS